MSSTLVRSERQITACSPHEKQVWQAYASGRDVTLSHFVRVCLNNVTGVNDPPDLDMFDEADLAGFTMMTISQQDLRRLLREERRHERRTLYIVLASVVISVVALFLNLALQLRESFPAAF